MARLLLRALTAEAPLESRAVELNRRLVASIASSAFQRDRLHLGAQ